MSTANQTQSKCYEYNDLTRQSGQYRAGVFIIFSLIFIIRGLNEWQETGVLPTIWSVIFLFIEPSRPLEILFYLLGYGSLSLIALVAFCFLLTTHPSIEIGQKGIRVHTLFRASPWLSPKNVYLVTTPSSRRPELLLIGIHGLGWPFLINGLWYLRRWQQAIVVSKGFVTGIKDFAELRDFFQRCIDT